MNRHNDVTYARIVTIALLLALLLSGCATSTAPEPTTALKAVTLKLNWIHGTQFLGFYVAQKRGYYAEEGFEVSIEPVDTSRGDDVVVGMTGGEYDFAIGASDLLAAQGRNIPLVAIATIFQHGPQAFFARADSGIVTPADLAGKRIAIKSDSWQNLLEPLLAHDGLTLEDVELVPTGFDMQPFLDGEVDVWAGYLSDEVVNARLLGLELVTLPLYEYGINTPALTIFTMQSTLEANPDLAIRFTRASLRGWAWAVENPTKAVEIMLNAFPEMAAERDFHQASFDVTIPLVAPPGSRLGEIDCATWQTHELLADLESTAGLCTTAIWEEVWQEGIAQ